MSSKLAYLSKYGSAHKDEEAPPVTHRGRGERKKKEKSRTKRGRKDWDDERDREAGVPGAPLVGAVLRDLDDLDMSLPADKVSGEQHGDFIDSGGFIEEGEDADEDGPTIVPTDDVLAMGGGEVEVPPRGRWDSVNRGVDLPKRRSRRGDDSNENIRSGGRRGHMNESIDSCRSSPLRRRKSYGSNESRSSPERRRRRYDSDDDSRSSPPRRKRPSDSESSTSQPGRRRRHDSTDDSDSERRHVRHKRADGYSNYSGDQRVRLRHDSDSDSAYKVEEKHRRRRRDSKRGEEERKRRRNGGACGSLRRRIDGNNSDEGQRKNSEKKMSSGHAAGLQDASTFREAESIIQSKRQIEMAKSVGEAHRKTVYRDKHGRKLDVHAELNKVQKEKKAQIETAL